MSQDLSLTPSFRRGIVNTFLHGNKIVLETGLVPFSAINFGLEAFARSNGVPENFRATPWYGRGKTFPKHIVKGMYIRPSHKRTGRTLMYFHGGGYHIGSYISHRRLVHNIAENSETEALFIEYRMAPKDTYPAALHDAISAYETLLERGVPPQKIAFAGDSAGGALALAVTLWLKDHKKPLPAAVVALSPWTDLTNSGESMISQDSSDNMISKIQVDRWADSYLGGVDRRKTAKAREPYASPLFGNYKGFVPTLVQVSLSETLRDDSLRLVDRMKKQNVDVTLQTFPNKPHGFQLLDKSYPSAMVAISNIGNFLKSIF